MNVKLAAQTLSGTNANILNIYYGPETTQTALYCKHMNNFFNCLNVKSTKEEDYSRNEFLKPYATENDLRFDWLQNTLLPYFDNWKHNILQRPGNFTASVRQKIFIFRQTHEGIQIICYSVIEATKYLLKEGCQFVLTERFCQDVLEEYFGHQRGIGRRNDNPTVFNLAIMIILFVSKGQLLILQEIQELHIKIKEQTHGMMLTTSFFKKEKRNNYTLATYIYIYIYIRR